jgi:hypothetical protein
MIPNPYKIIAGFGIGLALLVAAFFFGLHQGKQAGDLAIAQFEVAKVKEVAELDKKLAVVSSNVRTEYITKTNTIHENQIVYKDKIVLVPEQQKLSNGWISFHDGVTKGQRPSDALISDATPSPYSDRQALDVITKNYPECKADRARLAGLQDLITKAQATVNEKGVKK